MVCHLKVEEALVRLAGALEVHEPLGEAEVRLHVIAVQLDGAVTVLDRRVNVARPAPKPLFLLTYRYL